MCHCFLGLHEFAASNGVTDLSELSELAELSDGLLNTDYTGGDSFLQGIALSSSTISAVSKSWVISYFDFSNEQKRENSKKECAENKNLKANGI